jgi:hypothetical protein
VIETEPLVELVLVVTGLVLPRRRPGGRLLRFVVGQRIVERIVLGFGLALRPVL